MGRRSEHYGTAKFRHEFVRTPWLASGDMVRDSHVSLHSSKAFPGRLQGTGSEIGVTRVSQVGTYGGGLGWYQLDDLRWSEWLWWFHTDVSGCLATYL